MYWDTDFLRNFASMERMALSPYPQSLICRYSSVPGVLLTMWMCSGRKSRCIIPCVCKYVTPASTCEDVHHVQAKACVSAPKSGLVSQTDAV